MGPLRTAVFDTNILIDFLNAVDQAAIEIASCERRLVSFVTVIEVLSGCATVAEEQAARRLLNVFEVVRIPDALVQRTVEIRQQRRLKLPDSIVLATALDAGCSLVTRNTKDFPASDPAIRVPYTL